MCAASDPAWLERRREGITATDIVTIAGLVTWDSPWARYHRKLGLLPEVEQSDRMRLGSWLEMAVAAEWWRHHPADEPVRGGLFRSTVRTWQMATPDAVVGCEPDGYCGGHAVLECKSSATRIGWGEDGSDQVPAHVRAQVLWQMDTLGVGTGHVAVVFLPSGEFRSYTIRHDGCHEASHEDVCPDCKLCDEVDGLRDLGFGFWSRILRRRPPDLDGLEVTTEALKALHPVTLPPAVELSPGLVFAYDSAAEARKIAESTYRKAQNDIRSAMGDAGFGLLKGEFAFSRRIGKRAGYTVPPGETDVLRRIGKDKNDG